MTELTLTKLRSGSGGTNATPLLELQAVSVNVGIRKVIEGLDLRLEEHGIICVTGPNGSGKSTLLNAIAGLTPARITSGRILFSGSDITALPAHERARLGISFMRQRENVFQDMTVEENLRLALGRDGYDRFQDAQPQWVESLPRHKRTSLLSGGERQRLAWAMATLRSARLLLADEPEAGLSDPLFLPTTGSCIVVSHSPDGAIEDAEPVIDDLRSEGAGKNKSQHPGDSDDDS